MPETASERLRCGRTGSGRQQQAEPQSEKGKQPEALCPSPPRPRDSPPTSGSKIIPVVAGSTLMALSHLQSLRLQQCCNDVEGRRQLQNQLQNQHRPSVLRQGSQASSQAASRRQFENDSSQAISLCKVEEETGHSPQSSPPHSGFSPRHPHHPLPLRRGSPKQSSEEARLHDGRSGSPGSGGAASVLFVNGLCRWPGCDAAFQDVVIYKKHLHSEHGHGDKSLAQWRVQQDMVRYMESQLTLEKQKLFAMQLHLHLSERKSTELRAASDWPYGVAVFLPQPQAPDGSGAAHCATKGPEELSQHAFWPTGTVHLLPDLFPSIDCYKYNNIRPPYTYAYLIRWSILESPDKQRTLNEIYNWFTTMFFYFRHNTATWKNAVRHNLSLHKCFVRVEGGKGAVWTVDETEYQRRKGQKYYRDHPVKWLTPYSHFCPEEP